jgi:hypothetical protein
MKKKRIVVLDNNKCRNISRSFVLSVSHSPYKTTPRPELGLYTEKKKLYELNVCGFNSFVTYLRHCHLTFSDSFVGRPDMKYGVKCRRRGNC